MESDSVTSSRRTVEEIFKDFSARRSGIVRALTHGVSLSLSYLPRPFLIIFHFLVIIFSYLLGISSAFQMWMISTRGAIQVYLHFWISTAEFLSKKYFRYLFTLALSRIMEEFKIIIINSSLVHLSFCTLETAIRAV